MKTRLEILHEKVKNNKFRLNGEERYFKTYDKQIAELLEEFYNVIKEDKSKEYVSGIGYFYHEMASNIWHIGYELECIKENREMADKTVETSQAKLMIELGLNAIHTYIISKEFNTYRTYYLGCNYDKKKGRWSTYEYKNDKWVCKVK